MSAASASVSGFANAGVFKPGGDVDPDLHQAGADEQDGRAGHDRRKEAMQLADQRAPGELHEAADHQRGHRGREAHVLRDGDDRTDEDVEHAHHDGQPGADEAHAERRDHRRDAAADHRSRHHRDPGLVGQVEETRDDQRAAHHRGEHHQHVLDPEERGLDRAGIVVQLVVELDESAVAVIRCPAASGSAGSAALCAHLPLLL